jgi:pantothenate kinase
MYNMRLWCVLLASLSLMQCVSGFVQMYSGQGIGSILVDDGTRMNNLSMTWEAYVAEEIQKHCPPVPNASRGRGNHRRPYMVAIVGVPGSGKTSSARILSCLCGEERTLDIPFDGYHYPLATLRIQQDPNAVVYRRGAPDTFDSELLLRDLRRIRYGDEATVALPGFDHAAGDPQPDQHVFVRDRHDIVITEGLYLLHDADGWSTIQDYFDLKVYIDADLEACMDRLKIRNQCIPGYTADEIAERVDAVDRVNAHTVIRTKSRADLVVKSVGLKE